VEIAASRKASAVARTCVTVAFRLSGSLSAKTGEPESIMESKGDQNDKRGDESCSKVSWPWRGCTRRHCKHARKKKVASGQFRRRWMARIGSAGPQR
jgi:hypothetical protein